VHVNPIQEWIQPEGNKIKYPPIDTVKRLLDKVHFPIIVKEVGQGMGPESLRELLKLPLAAIEFAAFGGTNFAEIERLRGSSISEESFQPLSRVGMDAYQMLDAVNQIVNDEEVQCKQLIISGGVKSYLDGYYFVQKSLLPALYGQASSFLLYAREDYEKLHTYISAQIKGLEMAYAYLRIRS
jgi:isopentenyl-diphosphate delta-isomerase